MSRLFSRRPHHIESILEKMRLNSMPLCSTHQLRRIGLMLGTALITVVGAPFNLRAQQLNPSSSTTSSSNESATLASPPLASELPDAPSALLDPQSGQKSDPTPPPQTAIDPDAVSPN